MNTSWHRIHRAWRSEEQRHCRMVKILMLLYKKAPSHSLCAADVAWVWQSRGFVQNDFQGDISRVLLWWSDLLPRLAFSSPSSPRAQDSPSFPSYFLFFTPLLSPHSAVLAGVFLFFSFYLLPTEGALGCGFKVRRRNVRQWHSDVI